MGKGDINEYNMKLTRSERIAKAKKAGEASGIARGKKKSAREFAEAALNAEVVVKDAIIQGVIKKAIQEKDLAAIKYLFELTGESPAQKMEITGAEGKDLIPQKVLSRSEMKKLLKELENE